MTEYTCPACGDTYHSPISAAMCEDRDHTEDRAARRPRNHRPERYYPSED